MDVSHKAIGHFSQTEYQSVGILYFIFGTIGVVSNAFVALTFMKESVLPSAKKVLHINLAVANILVCAGFPFSGLSSFRGRWLFGEAGCQAYGVESFAGGTSAVMFVLVLGMERYLASCKSEFYNTLSSGMMWFVALLCWLYGLVWGLFPILGWSSYGVESSATACGINWLQKDSNHTSYLIVLVFSTGIATGISMFCINSARAFWKNNIIKEVKPGESDWFTEKQLVWISIAFFMFLIIGFGPYTYFAVWAAYTDSTTVSMLAVTLPPLFAKGATSLYPLPYILASERFRVAYSGGPDVTEQQKTK